MRGIKSSVPYDVGLFFDDYVGVISNVKSPRQLETRVVSHSYANNFVLHHHYLHRKIYIARNVSYGLFAGTYCVGVLMYGFPVWIRYPKLVPPYRVEECPELIRLATVSGLQKNSESWFIARTMRSLPIDWEKETGTKPKVITSFCDTAFGFNGALYKATNFVLLNVTKGRATNVGGTHGKWKPNTDSQKSEKLFYVYHYDKAIP